ncbi:MAG: thiamine phosphate synthase [Pseudomonadota bacterium]
MRLPLTAKLNALVCQALEDVSPACILICPGSENLEVNALDEFIDRIQGAGAACLIEDRITAAAEIGADGVHLSQDPNSPNGMTYQEARELLGESANIGVGCGLVRHDAMELAEAGADYVAFSDAKGGDFDTVLETIAWWSEIFVVPSVAWNVAKIDDARRLTEAGADFIAPPSTIWDSDRAMEVLCEMDRTIGTIRREA